MKSKVRARLCSRHLMESRELVATCPTGRTFAMGAGRQFRTANRRGKIGLAESH